MWEEGWQIVFVEHDVIMITNRNIPKKIAELPLYDSLAKILLTSLSVTILKKILLTSLFITILQKYC